MGLAHAWGLALGDIYFYINDDILSSLGSLFPPEVRAEEVLRDSHSLHNRDELLKELDDMLVPGSHFKKVPPPRDSNKALHLKHQEHLEKYHLIGWNYGIYSALVRWGHHMGYLTTDEVWQRLERIRPEVQQTFPGWAQFALNFHLGRVFLFSNDPLAGAITERAMSFLLNSPWSKWKQIEWYTQDLSASEANTDPLQLNPFHVDLSGSAEQHKEKLCRYYHAWSEAAPTETRVLRTYGRRLQELGKHLPAIAVWTKAAALGCYYSAHDLGQAYNQALGVEQDLALAKQWYRQAITLGSPLSPFALARLLTSSSDQQEWPQGVDLMRQCAENNHGEAQWRLANAYVKGILVDKDIDHALHWFDQAIANNYSDAFDDLGVLYEMGEEVEKDLDQAISLYRDGAQLGNKYAQTNLGRVYQHGIGIQADAGQAILWLERAAQQGYVGAMSRLGDLYKNGEPPHNDIDKSIHWYQKGVQGGYPDCLYGLALIYFKKEGYTDTEKAFDCLERLAEKGGVRAYNELGRRYLNAIDTQQNPDKAFTYYSLSAEQEDSTGLYNLGLCYQDGIGTDQNDALAFEQYAKAAALGHHRAQHALALLYDAGCGTEQDYQLAQKWLIQSALGNNEPAIPMLAHYLRYAIAGEADLAEAVRWLRRGVELNSVDALYQLIELWMESPAPDDQKTALEFLQDLTAQDHPDIQYLTGYAYQCDSPFRNISTAVSYYERAADALHTTALRALDSIYENGDDGIETDPNKSFHYCSLAAEQNDPQAITNLGTYYVEGFGTPRDLQAAAQLYLRSFEHGNEFAVGALSTIYHDQDFAGEDAEQARQFIKQEALRGNPAAQQAIQATDA